MGSNKLAKGKHKWYNSQNDKTVRVLENENV